MLDTRKQLCSAVGTHIRLSREQTFRLHGTKITLQVDKNHAREGTN
jgi:hypothetical protein